MVCIKHNECTCQSCTTGKHEFVRYKNEICKLRQNLNPIMINTNTSHKGEKTAQGANEGKRQTHQETH